MRSPMLGASSANWRLREEQYRLRYSILTSSPISSSHHSVLLPHRETKTRTSGQIGVIGRSRGLRFPGEGCDQSQRNRDSAAQRRYERWREHRGKRLPAILLQRAKATYGEEGRDADGWRSQERQASELGKRESFSDIPLLRQHRPHLDHIKTRTPGTRSRRAGTYKDQHEQARELDRENHIAASSSDERPRTAAHRFDTGQWITQWRRRQAPIGYSYR